MKKINFLLILLVVLSVSCKKNDTIRDMGESQGFVSNVYMEAQSEIIKVGSSLKIPVTYWLPNEDIKVLNLRETVDSSFAITLKNIAGSTFSYNNEIRGIIDTNIVSSTYEHSESNWSDAHTNFRIYAEYGVEESNKTLYFEGMNQVNDFITSSPEDISENLLDVISNDFATQMTKDQMHRSLVSVSSEEKFEDLWGGLMVSGADELFNKVIKRNKSKDELLIPYFPYNDPIQKLGIKYLFGLNESQMTNLFCTKRPKLLTGNVVVEVTYDAIGDTIFDPNGDAVYDTVWLDKTPYMGIDDLLALYSADIPNKPAEAYIENSINYEKQYNADFEITYLVSERIIGAGIGSSVDPVYAKDELKNLFVNEVFAVDDVTFESYFSGETINESSIEDVVKHFKDLAKKTNNEKILGYKPKAKRYYSVSLEFQVEGESGVIGKSNIVHFKVK